MTNSIHPKVSISVITYNQKSFLIECLDSCLAQDYSNFEIVIADDGSSDGTQDVAMDYQRRYPYLIRFVHSGANGGISKNCNSAWKACSGEWIKTIAGDDRLKPDCLSSFVNEVLKDGGACDAYFSRMTNFDQDGNLNEVLLDDFFYSLSDDDRLKYFFYRNPLPAPTSFIKRAALEEVGFADEKYVMLEDYPLWFNFLQAKKKIKPVDVSTIFYREGFGVSKGTERICNISYVRSLHSFRVEKLWPHLESWSFFKKMDDLAYFYQRSIGYQYFGNKKGVLYYFLVLLMAPARLFSLLLLSKKFFMLVIRTTALR